MIYITIVRCVLEYACVVWNHNLPTSQSDKLESIQKRALRIINGDVSFGMPYASLLYLSDLESLSNRRSKLSKTYFDKICHDDSCLHDLLPPKRPSTLLDKLRNPSTYPVPSCHTKCYQSIIMVCCTISFSLCLWIQQAVQLLFLSFIFVELWQWLCISIVC